MGLRYTFESVDEFVRFLKNSASDCRTRAMTHSERSHIYAKLHAEAASYERIAIMVSASNLKVVI